MVQLLSISTCELLLMIGLYYLGRHHGEVSKTTIADHKAKLDKILKDAYKDLKK